MVKMRTLPTSGFIYLTLMSVNAAFAENNVITIGELPTIQVRASLLDELSERQSLSAAKIVVGQAELEKFADLSMGEVIRRMPSISFGGPPGENNDARLRGLHKDYTQIMLDGRPVNGRDFAIDQIPASQVERIEIIRSTTASMDSQGVAGTVNIVLKKTPDQLKRSFKITGGLMPDAPNDGKAGSLNINLGDRVGDVGYLLTASVQNRYGIREKDRKDYTDETRTTLRNREQDLEVREHDEYALSARLDWQVNDQQRLLVHPKLNVSNENKDRDRLKKADLSDREFMNAQKERRYLGTDVSWSYEPDDGIKHQIDAQIQRKNEKKDQNDSKGKQADARALLKFASGSHESIDESSSLLGWKGLWAWDVNHALELGIEWTGSKWEKNKQAWKKDDKADLTMQRAKIDEDKFSVYLQDEYLWTDQTILTSGLRVESVSGQAIFDRNTSDLERHVHLNPSVHLLHKLTEQTNWRASVSRSIRRPKYDDLVPFSEQKDGSLDSPDKVGNPNLKPETAWGVETSVEHYFFQKQGVLTANLFYRNLSNLIEKQTILNAAQQRFEELPVNVDSAKMWGVELDGSRKMDHFGLTGLTLRGNLSLLDSSTQDRTTLRSRRVNEQPKYILNAGLDYEYRPWRTTLGFNYNRVGSLEKHDLSNGNARVQRQEPSHYLDAYLTHQLNKDFRLRLSGINLPEIEKNRPRTTYDAAGKIIFFEQEEERSGRSYFLTLEGKF